MVFPHPHYKAVDVSTAQSGEEPKTFFGQTSTLKGSLVLINGEHEDTAFPKSSHGSPD